MCAIATDRTDGHARSFSIVVPVYNGESSLPELIRQIGDVMPDFGGPFEVILVNDASPDRSWDAIKRLAGEHAWVRGINFARNYGQHSALVAGIRAARYDIVITMDDDLEHPPSEIGKLLDMLDQGYDVVYGAPNKQQHGIFRDTAAALTKLALADALGAGTARNISSFRAFRTQLRDAFAACDGPNLFLDALLSWGTSRFGYVVVRHDPRRAGTSNYTLRKLTVHAINILTSFCLWPLRIATVLGVAIAGAGVAGLVLVAAQYVATGVQGYGTLMLASVVGVVGGANLLAIGIASEYLARMHSRVMGRPAYAIRDVTPAGEAVEASDGRMQTTGTRT